MNIELIYIYITYNDDIFYIKIVQLHNNYLKNIS